MCYGPSFLEYAADESRNFRSEKSTLEKKGLKTSSKTVTRKNLIEKSLKPTNSNLNLLDWNIVLPFNMQQLETLENQPTFA